MKIRRKVPILEVEIYKPGMEDGFKDLVTSEQSVFDSPIRMPYILTINGEEIVNNGDWVIINPLSPGGRRGIINKYDFKNFDILEE